MSEGGVRRLLIWVPLAVFAGIALLAVFGLRTPADRTIRSALAGKPLPDFALKPLVPGKPGVSSGVVGGKPRLLNVFASWCIPCVAEAPQLLELKRRGIRIDGVAIHDTAAAVGAFLGRNGDPYAAIGDDPVGRVQLSLGSSGVPETFVIDGKGTIVSQHVGDIRADEVDGIEALVRGAAR